MREFIYGNAFAPPLFAFGQPNIERVRELRREKREIPSLSINIIAYCLPTCWTPKVYYVQPGLWFMMEISHVAVESALHTQNKQISHKMSSTDYGGIFVLFTKRKSLIAVISKLSLRVMFFRCTLGVADWEREKKVYLYRHEHLASTQWLITGRGMCAYILFLLTRSESTPMLIVATQKCVDDQIIKQFHLIWPRKDLSILFEGAGKPFMCVSASPLHWKLFCLLQLLFFLGH